LNSFTALVEHHTIIDERNSFALYAIEIESSFSMRTISRSIESLWELHTQLRQLSRGIKVQFKEAG
jgi:hypothetical protein